MQPRFGFWSSAKVRCLLWVSHSPSLFPVRGERHFQEGSVELQIPRFAPPDFLLILVALANLMRLSLKERRIRFANATNINRKSGGAKRGICSSTDPSWKCLSPLTGKRLGE